VFLPVASRQRRGGGKPYKERLLGSPKHLNVRRKQLPVATRQAPRDIYVNLVDDVYYVRCLGRSNQPCQDCAREER
jgi:hypothetical protein